MSHRPTEADHDDKDGEDSREDREIAKEGAAENQREPGEFGDVDQQSEITRTKQ